MHFLFCCGASVDEIVGLELTKALAKIPPSPTWCGQNKTFESLKLAPLKISLSQKNPWPGGPRPLGKAYWSQMHRYKALLHLVEEVDRRGLVSRQKDTSKARTKATMPLAPQGWPKMWWPG